MSGKQRGSVPGPGWSRTGPHGSWPPSWLRDPLVPQAGPDGALVAPARLGPEPEETLGGAGDCSEAGWLATLLAEPDLEEQGWVLGPDGRRWDIPSTARRLAGLLRHGLGAELEAALAETARFREVVTRTAISWAVAGYEWLLGPTPPARPRPGAARCPLDPAAQQRLALLRHWVDSGEADRMPPCDLGPGRRVVDAGRFCRALLGDFSGGAGGSRCRMGVAQKDLELLVRRWPGGPPGESEIPRAAGESGEGFDSRP
jgi:hypothetical protein